MPGRFYRDIDFPIPYFQTYRAISLCSNIKDGISRFNKLCGNKDKVWLELLDQYRDGLEPVIRYVSRDEKNLFKPIPLSRILLEGWRMF